MEHMKFVGGYPNEDCIYPEDLSMDEKRDNPEKKIYCQIDSMNTDEDTYYTISSSFEEFLINMDKELADWYIPG